MRKMTVTAVGLGPSNCTMNVAFKSDNLQTAPWLPSLVRFSTLPKYQPLQIRALSLESVFSCGGQLIKYLKMQSRWEQQKAFSGFNVFCCHTCDRKAVFSGLLVFRALKTLNDLEMHRVGICKPCVLCMFTVSHTITSQRKGSLIDSRMTFATPLVLKAAN